MCSKKYSGQSLLYVYLAMAFVQCFFPDIPLKVHLCNQWINTRLEVTSMQYDKVTITALQLIRA